MKKIIVIAIFLFFPCFSFGKENWNFSQSGNNIKVEGNCSGESSVRIDLFSLKDRENAAYTSGAWCQKGRFRFSDNISQWKSLEKGEYSLVVNGDKKNSRKFILERPDEKNSSVKEEAVENFSQEDSYSEEEIDLKPEAEFISAFADLQNSILSMRQWLSETGYPSLVKESLEFGIDGLDLAVGKISNLVLDIESSENGMEEESKNEVREGENSVNFEEISSGREEEVFIDINNSALQLNGEK